jgi:tripartite-type tricarboxylate transporter receptor subunit TctC
MRQLISMVLSMFCLAAVGPDAYAQGTYPSKPIKILVPYGPGGSTDVTTRFIVEHLRKSLGGTYVVENKPGASGLLAIEQTALARPDGYTVMVGNISTNALTPLLYAKKMTINYEKDLTIVAHLGELQAIFISTNRSDFPPKSVSELISYAKQQPDKLMFGSAGIGSIQSFDYGVLMKLTGIKVREISYKSGPDIIRDLVRGDTQLSSGPYASSVNQIRAGLIRPLAVVGDKRLEDLPGVQTMAEAGYPNVGSNHWQIMVAPANTPKEILDTLHKAVAEAVRAPAVLASFQTLYYSPPPPRTREQTVNWMRDEFAKWKRTIGDLKITVED